MTGNSSSRVAVCGKSVFSFLAVMCVGATALGDDYSWNVSTGGNLDSPGNWTPQGTPGAGDKAILRYVQSAPYTLSGDSLSVNAVDIQNSATIDIGAGKSFLAEGDKTYSKISLWPNVTLRLLSGTFGVGDTGNRFFLGDLGDGSKVIVSGANSTLRSSKTSNIIVGQNMKNCNLLVQDGGTLSGGIWLGVNNAGASSNVVVITGSGTRFLSDATRYTTTDRESASAIIGFTGSFNELAVSNGAEMVVGDGRAVLLGAQYGTSDPVGYGNVFKITHGATAAIDYVYAGHSGSSNSVLVADGGELSVSNMMYVGYSQSGDLVVDGNSVRVTGEGSRLFVKNKLVIGNPRCPNGMLEVADGGSMECEGSVSIGTKTSPASVFQVKGGFFSCTNVTEAKYIDIIGNGSRFSLLDGAVASLSNTFFNVGDTVTGSANALFEMRGGSRLTHVQPSGSQDRYYLRGIGSRFVVDGSTIDAPGLFICSGKYNSNAVSNSLEFVNGAAVNAYRIVVGDHGDYCSLDVDDSTLSLSMLHLGYSGSGSTDRHAVMRVRGANAKISVTSDFLPRNDTTLEFTVPPEGFLNQPVIQCRGVETTCLTSPTLVVKKYRNFDGGRIVLIQTTGTDIDMTAFVEHFNVILPEGCSLDLTNPREIAVKMSASGMSIFVR